MAIRARVRGGIDESELRRFSRKVQESGIRVKSLAASQPRSAAQELSTALEELELHNEELRVAEEELRAQLEALAEARGELELERARYGEIFQLNPNPQLVTDKYAVVREANAALVTLLNLEGRLLRGKPLAAFLDSEDVHTLNRALEELTSGTPKRLVLTLKTRRNTLQAVVANVAMSESGERLFWTLDVVRADAPSVTSGDVERALRDRDELYQRERSAREGLERANRAKDRFIALLAHDLRSPLNAVLGWTQMLRNEVLDRDGRDRALATIERNGKNQLHLIEELLDVSRMAADRVQLELFPLDFSLLVERHLETAMPAIKAKELDIAVDIAPGLTVVADRQRLEQVLSNLVSNAVKYTDTGGRIGITVRRAGQRARLDVGDTGKGIPKDVLPHVFEMYLQERTYASSRSGIGLGLYIVKQLVELHGGSVAGASDGSGRGSTFTVELPLHENLQAVSSEHDLPATMVKLHNLRVLVVDDDADARELIAAIAREAGGDVATAASRDAALEVFEFWQPDVLVSDLAMPGGDGFDLVSKLRAQHRRPFAALAVSGFTAERDSTSALAAGFDVHIAKPINAVELVEAIGEAAQLRNLIE